MLKSTNGQSCEPDSFTQEQWKPVPILDLDYKASDQGRIMGPSGTILKYRIIKGYSIVTVTTRAGRDQGRVQRLVASAFLKDFNELPEVDHLNGKKSDNRLCNLRMVTRIFNQRGYQSPTKGSSSVFRGVSRNGRSKKWLARIGINRKTITIGSFSNEIEAATAWNRKALSLGYHENALNDVHPLTR